MKVLKFSIVFILLILANILFYRKKDFEEKRTYEIQKSMIAYSL
jgi:hypothetical protein